MFVCSVCDGMGRVVFERADARLTTKTCANCNGVGSVEDHDTVGCSHCAHARAGQERAVPMF